MTQITSKTCIDSSSLKLFSKFESSILADKNFNNNPAQSETDIDDVFARAVATFCLDNNIKADKFYSLFRFQLVDILKANDPKISHVQISARTGINRRSIGSIDKNAKPTKDMLILSYLQSYCKTYKTSYINKKGLYNSFDYFCKLGANGSLTTMSISKELLRLGHLEEKGSRYRIIFTPKT